MVKSKTAVKKQKGGKNDPNGRDDYDENYDVDAFETYKDNTDNTDNTNALVHEEYYPEYNDIELGMLKNMIKTARKSKKKQQRIGHCMDVKTLMQHEFGICYYVSLIHTMFFSRGMRRYIGRQIQYLESKLLATQEYEDYKWFFIMLWNMIERPTFYKNFNWTFDLCYNLGTSLVASCKLMEDMGDNFGYNQSHIDKSGLVFTLGYNYFITRRASIQNTGKGGYIGEALKPILCSLEMNNVLFLTIENYDYSKQQALTYHLSMILKKYKQFNIKIDIIALKVYPDRKVEIGDNYQKTYKVAEELSLNGTLYTLDSAQMQNKPDGSENGHVIAGITCPYPNGNKYPKLVLNSWKDNDVIEADWNNSHIVIRGNDMTAYKTYSEAMDAYNNNKEKSNNVQQDRPEAFNMLFSASQNDCLYFYTREETSEMDKIDEDRIKENVLTKASMILGKKPDKVSPNGDNSDMDNYYLDLLFTREDGEAVETNLKIIGLVPNDSYKIKDATENKNIVISVKYNKFVELCQDKLGLVEDILVITGKVPIDIVVADTKQSGGVNVQKYPPPPRFPIRIPNAIKGQARSILDSQTSSNTNKVVKHVYFGVKGEIPQDVIEKYQEGNFLIQSVNKDSFVSVWKGKGNIERQLNPGLVYYKFDYDKYIELFVHDGTQSGGEGIKRKTNLTRERTRTKIDNNMKIINR